MGNIYWQYQHLCLSFSSGTGNGAGSERAERCYTVSADLRYRMISNRVSGCRSAALLPASGRTFPLPLLPPLPLPLVTGWAAPGSSERWNSSFILCLERREKREDGVQLFRLRFDCTFTKPKRWWKKLIIESGLCVLLPHALCSYAFCMHIQMSK